MFKRNILRRPAVETLTGLSRSSIYDYMKKGLFPMPIKIGVRAVGWRSADLSAWLDSREEGTFTQNETQSLLKQGLGSISSRSLEDTTASTLPINLCSRKQSFCTSELEGRNNA